MSQNGSEPATVRDLETIRFDGVARDLAESEADHPYAEKAFARHATVLEIRSRAEAIKCVEAIEAALADTDDGTVRKQLRRVREELAEQEARLAAKLSAEPVIGTAEPEFVTDGGTVQTGEVDRDRRVPPAFRKAIIEGMTRDNKPVGFDARIFPSGAPHRPGMLVVESGEVGAFTLRYVREAGYEVVGISVTDSQTSVHFIPA